jgi:hypothetical protein
MNYEEIEGDGLAHIIIDLGDGAFKSFPVDPTNPDYEAFLESLNDDTEAE